MLRLEGIHAGYDGVEVLRGVDLTVPSGATVALLGANGAGKTTLLRVAAGLVPTRSGCVELDGSDITEEAPHRLQKFSADGKFVAKWGGDDPNGSWLHGQFNRPSGVAVDAEDQVYVVDTSNHRIQKFRSTGAFVP